MGKYQVAETHDGFAVTDTTTDEVEHLTIDEACSILLKRIYESLYESRDTVCRQYAMDRDRLAAPGALTLRVEDFESMLYATDKMRVKFVPSKFLKHIHDARVRKGLELTQWTRDALLIVNFQIHSRNKARDEEGCYAEPGPIGLVVLSPSNQCGNVDCEGELPADVITMAQQKKGEIPYCSGACRKVDHQIRKKLSKFCRNQLGIHNMKLTERKVDDSAVPSFVLDEMQEEEGKARSAAIVPKASRVCPRCKAERVKADFAKQQWRAVTKSDGKRGACKMCTVATVATVEAMIPGPTAD